METVVVVVVVVLVDLLDVVPDVLVELDERLVDQVVPVLLLD